MSKFEELQAEFLHRMRFGHMVLHEGGGRDGLVDLTHSIRPFYFLKTVNAKPQPSNADGQERIARRLAELLEVPHWDTLKSLKDSSPLLVNKNFESIDKPFPGQTCGAELEKLTSWFLRESFIKELNFLRPGGFRIMQGGLLKHYSQYRHLGDFDRVLEFIPPKESALRSRLKAAFSSYSVRPDLVITRRGLSRKDVERYWREANSHGEDMHLLSADTARFTPLLSGSDDRPDLLHAIVSVKWSLRSDRAQNSRTEGSFAMQQRRGNAPRFVVLTGEPKPSRIRSLTEGADVDCVYHISLDRLKQAVAEVGGTDADESSIGDGKKSRVSTKENDHLEALLQMNRLRDVTDLPFDLAI